MGAGQTYEKVTDGRGGQGEQTLQIRFCEGDLASTPERHLCGTYAGSGGDTSTTRRNRGNTAKPGARKNTRLRIPDVLNNDEQKSLHKVPNKRYPTGLRNVCMMRVMLDGGLGSSELPTLRVQDAYLESGRLKVRRGKGGKGRVLWVGRQTLKQLNTWLDRRQVESHRMFTRLNGAPVNPRYLRAMIKRYGQKAGIQKDVHPHALRYSFATDFYRETKNLRMVQKALGHAFLTTTRIYTQIVDEELENALREFRNGNREQAGSRSRLQPDRLDRFGEISWRPIVELAIMIPSPSPYCPVAL